MVTICSDTVLLVSIFQVLDVPIASFFSSLDVLLCGPVLHAVLYIILPKAILVKINPPSHLFDSNLAAKLAELFKSAVAICHAK